MILESIRMICDTLNTGSLSGYSGSVNNLLLTIPKDSGDATPPSMSCIVDETRSDIVASGRYPITYPNLIVTVADNTRLDGETYSDNRDADVAILIRYVQSTNDGAVSTQNTYYTLRAVERCVANFMKSSNVLNRVRNNIQIIECNSIEHVPVYGVIEDLVCTGALKYIFHVRDVSPTI